MLNPFLFLFLSIALNSTFLANGVYAGPLAAILSGQHFVIGTLPDLPYVKFQITGGMLTNVDGSIPQIIKWLAEKHNFTYHYTQPADKAYGGKVNGTWNGIVGDVLRGNVNLGATNVGITYERFSVVDFTYAFANDRMVFLVPYPRLASTISGIVRPFHYKVWIGVLLSLYAVSVTLCVIEMAAYRTIYKAGVAIQRVMSNLWFLFRSLTNAENEQSFTQSTKILVAFWCLATFVLVQSYTSCLISYLTTPKFIPIANTIGDIADNGELSLVVWKFTSMEPVILGATNGPLVKLGNKLRTHPENRLDSYKNIADIIASKPSAAPYEATVSTLIDSDLKRTKKCRIATAKEYLFENRLAFVMPKSTPYITRIFSEDLILLQQTGLIIHWTNLFKPNPNRCTTQLSSLRPPTGKTKLTLDFLSSVFIVYGVGGCFSIFLFIVELSIKCLTMTRLHY